MIHFLDSGDHGLEKGKNRACFFFFFSFLRFLRLGSKKIGVFLRGFFVAENGEVGISERAFFLGSVFKGLVGFGSPAVDKVRLLELSLLVGVVELRVRPQRI